MLGHVTMIDFPQMISINHLNASELFQRDLNGLIKFFAMKMGYIPTIEQQELTLEQIIPNESLRIDSEIEASGFVSKEESNDLNEYLIDQLNNETINEESENNNEEFDENENEETDDIEAVLIDMNEKKNENLMKKLNNKLNNVNENEKAVEPHDVDNEQTEQNDDLHDLIDEINEETHTTATKPEVSIDQVKERIKK